LSKAASIWLLRGPVDVFILGFQARMIQEGTHLGFPFDYVRTLRQRAVLPGQDTKGRKRITLGLIAAADRPTPGLSGNRESELGNRLSVIRQ
jgi:hypothetical protein